jgi:hypothetical protein
MRKANPDIHRDDRRREGGFSVGELLLITVPLCLLSMVAASKLAATSQARLRAQWQASLSAQQGATNLCGGSATLNGPWQNSQSKAKVHSIHGPNTPPVLDNTGSANDVLQVYTSPGQVASTLAHITSVGTIVSDTGESMRDLADKISATNNFPTDLLQQSQLTDTNWSVQTGNGTPPSYYYKTAADKLIADPKTPQTPSAAFICHEPEGANKMDDIRTQLLVWAFDESGKFYY